MPAGADSNQWYSLHCWDSTNQILAMDCACQWETAKQSWHRGHSTPVGFPEYWPSEGSLAYRPPSGTNKVKRKIHPWGKLKMLIFLWGENKLLAHLDAKFCWESHLWEICSVFAIEQCWGAVDSGYLSKFVGYLLITVSWETWIVDGWIRTIVHSLYTTSQNTRVIL